MDAKRALASCLSAFVCFPFLISTASACEAVVYAFRHAEDSSQAAPPFPCLRGSTVMCTTSLTPVGKMHAKHYLEMITNLSNQYDYCPVRYVFAVNPINPSGYGGTTNPFATGDPLSLAVLDRDPFVEIDGSIIDEKLTVLIPAVLHGILLGMAKSDASVALFWTSEGLNTLGNALGTNVIPKKTQTYSPPRNAAYLFKYRGGDAFTPPSKRDEYVQCFNYANGGSSRDNFTNKFWCGYGPNGNLDIPESDFEKLHAKICEVGGPDFTWTTSPPNYYGYCK